MGLMTPVKALLLLILAGLSPVMAEDRDPRLAPMVAKYQAKVDAINTREIVNQNQALKVYVDILKEAEEKATKGGDAQELAVISEERSKVQGGPPLPLPNPTLPKLLQAKRKIYCKAFDDAEKVIARETEDLNSKYLMALARMEPAEGGMWNLPNRSRKRRGG